MSGWGIYDDKTSSGTVAITTGGVVTGSSTAFESEAKVGDFLRVSAQEFVITEITSDTAAKVTVAKAGDTITVVNAGAQYTLSEKPKFLRYGFSNNTDTKQVFGVDKYEMAAPENAGITSLGWVHRNEVKTGAIAAVDNVGATDALRKPGLYLVSGTTSGSGTGQMFRVSVTSAGAASVEIVQSGSGHADNDTITVLDSLLGNGGAADLTFDVDGIKTQKRYETLVALADIQGDADDDAFIPESPSPTPSVTATPSVTPSATPSVTPSISVTPSVTPSISVTPSVTPSPSV